MNKYPQKWSLYFQAFTPYSAYFPKFTSPSPHWRLLSEVGNFLIFALRKIRCLSARPVGQESDQFSPLWLSWMRQSYDVGSFLQRTGSIGPSLRASVNAVLLKLQISLQLQNCDPLVLWNLYIYSLNPCSSPALGNAAEKCYGFTPASIWGHSADCGSWWCSAENSALGSWSRTLKMLKNQYPNRSFRMSRLRLQTRLESARTSCNFTKLIWFFAKCGKTRAERIAPGRTLRSTICVSVSF